MSREHNVEAMSEEYIGSGELEVVMLSILSNQLESRSFKRRLEKSENLSPPSPEWGLRMMQRDDVSCFSVPAEPKTNDSPI
jgi:hypothetical protein